MRILTIAMMLASGPAMAGETVVECDPPQGWSFYAESPPVTAEEWREGGFSEGDAVRLYRRDDGEVTVQFRVRDGEFRPIDGTTIRLAGAKVPTFFVDNGAATFELYTFKLNLGKLFWSRHRTGDLLTGVQAFEADCY